jgi:glutathione S-transferase
LIIVDYLLEEYDANKSLIPSSAARRAEARLFIEWFGANVATPLYKIAYEEHDENNKKEATLKVIANLDEKLSQLSSDGPFALGNEFTFADIATAPWAVQLEVGISDYNLSQDINKYKRYVAWKNAVLARPSVAQTAPTIEAIKERREKFREIIRQRNAAAAK